MRVLFIVSLFISSVVAQPLHPDLRDGDSFVIRFSQHADLTVQPSRSVIAALKRAQHVQDRVALQLGVGGARFRRHFSTNAITGRGASLDLLREISRLPEVESATSYQGTARYTIRSGAASAVSPFSEARQVK